MRISLVLIMVLTLATSAQAALSLSLSATYVVVGSDVTVSISSDNTYPWMGDFILSEDIEKWTDPVAAEYGEWWVKDPHIYRVEPVPGYPAVLQLFSDGAEAGIQFSIPIKGVQPGTIYIDLQDDTTFAEMANGPLTLVVVAPEPMTITLLALGGLLLPRRAGADSQGWEKNNGCFGLM